MRIFKNRVKILLGIAFYYSGLFRLIRAWNNLVGRRLTIVMYHRVTNGEVSTLAHSLPFMFVTAGAFESHLEFYKKHYRVLNFEELSSYAGNGKIPRNSLIITFDDGYKDNIVHALPLLRKYGCPWVLFLSTGYVGSKEVCWWDKFYCLMTYLRNCELQGRLPYLGRIVEGFYAEFKRDPSALFSSLNDLPTSMLEAFMKEMRPHIVHVEEEIQRDNHFMDWGDIDAVGPFTEFGAHTHMHVNLCTVGVTQAREEINLSKNVLEKHIKRKTLAFAYPAGRYNETTIGEVKKAGYSYAVIGKRGVNDLKNPYKLKRIYMWDGTVPRYDMAFSKGWLSYKLLGF